MLKYRFTLLLIIVFCLLLVNKNDARQLTGQGLSASVDLTEQVKLTASDGLIDDTFGISTSVSGDLAVIGASGKDIENNIAQGAAYIYERTGVTGWTQRTRLVAANIRVNDQFGTSVSVSGDRVIVGAPHNIVSNPDQPFGAAYVFERPWSNPIRLSVQNGTARNGFGTNVAISGDIAVVGSPFEGGAEQGAAYLYTRSGGNWTLQTKLTASDGVANDRFGGSVSVSGQTVIIGASRNSGGGVFRQGAAYVFVRSGSTWTLEQKLTANDPATSDVFGFSVSVDGDTAIIGAINVNSVRGAAYVFVRDSGVWTQQAKLSAGDGAPSDAFGSSVSISGGRAVIGAPEANSSRGSAYIFERNGTTWHQRAKLLASDGAANHRFGRVSISGDTAFVGATQANGLNQRQGAAYVFLAPPTPSVQFSATNYNVGEGDGSAIITVTRTGDTSSPITVDYTTSDGTASGQKDYTTALGTLTFAGGQTSKSIRVLLTDDLTAEGAEVLNISLSRVNGDAILGMPTQATLTILDNDSTTSPNNPLDTTPFYVRQHYHDFLNREPDAAGLAFWTNEIEQCGTDSGCREVKLINVSAAFFLSIEFQETGYLAYRMYKAAYGDATSNGVPGTVPIVRLREFLSDAQRVGQGVQVGVGNWQQQLEANKNAYALEFIQRARFRAAYPSTLTAEEFVSRLVENTGAALSPEERAALVTVLGTSPADAAKRAQAVRAVAEDADLRQAELNRAFVLMQYYGYLRRNPDDPQDTDFGGWRFWLDKLEQFNGDFVQAEMVKAFITSIEYRQRFGQ